jgi:hypothetical protein
MQQTLHPKRVTLWRFTVWARAMSVSSRVALLLIVLGLGGCSFHPLPEDVTGVDTSHIVRKIRCEARDAVIRKALAYLQYEGYQFDEHRLQTLNFNSLREPARSTLAYFSQTGIVLSFTLDMTESDGLSLQGNLIKPLSHGTFTLSPSAGDSVSRDNIRAFTVTDNFSDLVKKVDDSYCDFTLPGPNFQYPIVGKIGIDEIIDTFVDMTLFNDLGGKNDVATSAKRGPPTMADTITFTTTISGGLTPMVTLSPVGTSFQLMNASLAATAMRVDKHQVILGLGLPSAPQFTKTGFTAAFISAAPKQSGEAAAVQAVAQQIIRFESTKPLIVAP